MRGRGNRAFLEGQREEGIEKREPVWLDAGPRGLNIQEDAEAHQIKKENSSCFAGYDPERLQSQLETGGLPSKSQPTPVWGGILGSVRDRRQKIPEGYFPQRRQKTFFSVTNRMVPTQKKKKKSFKKGGVLGQLQLSGGEGGLISSPKSTNNKDKGEATDCRGNRRGNVEGPGDRRQKRQ